MKVCDTSMGDVALLLKHLVALSAMQHGRAPLPVPRSLLKAFVHHDFPGSIDHLEALVRRYLFFGDERLVLSELRMKAEASRIFCPALLKAVRTMGTCPGAS